MASVAFIPSLFVRANLRPDSNLLKISEQIKNNPILRQKEKFQGKTRSAVGNLFERRPRSYLLVDRPIEDLLNLKSRLQNE